MKSDNTPKSKITHNNHYVPQFYLDKWSSDHIHIYTYRLLVPDQRMPPWNFTPIKSTGSWLDFYTRVVDNEEVDDFEQWFNSEFETPVQPVIEKILNNTHISQIASKYLSRYIAAQQLRTPAGANNLFALMKKSWPDIIEDVHQKLNTMPIPKTKPTIPVEPDLFPVKITVDRDNRTIETETLVGRGMYLYALRYLLTNTVRIMDTYTWQVINAADGITFPTSDDPVICLNYYAENDYDFKGGWGMPNGNIIFPISPTKLLFTQIGSHRFVPELDRSQKWSLFFRRIIIEHAHRYIYDTKPNDDVAHIHPRCVDLDLFLSEQKETANWHSDQLKAEQNLMAQA